jgi:hypothetical protein
VNSIFFSEKRSGFSEKLLNVHRTMRVLGSDFGDVFSFPFEVVGFIRAADILLPRQLFAISPKQTMPTA